MAQARSAANSAVPPDTGRTDRGHRAPTRRRPPAGAPSANDPEFGPRDTRPGASTRSFLSWVSDRARALLDAFRRRSERETVDALHALGDRTLRDLGLNRSEIPSVPREVEDPATATRTLVVRSRRDG